MNGAARASRDRRSPRSRRRKTNGINIELGLGALVGLDASFSKFITADVQGEAHAELNATVQIQVPMNLFEEVGAAVRLRIAAEAAAGVTPPLGLNVGDLLALL